MALTDRLRRAYDALTSAPTERRADAPVVSSVNGLGDATVDKSVARRPGRRAWLTDDDLTWLYLQGGYWRRAVDLLPLEATRKGWRADLGDLRDVCATEDEALDVRARMREADAMGRLYGLGLLVMVTDDDADLSEPLPDGAAVRALHVYDGREVTVGEWDRDPESPTFREPLRWRVSPQGPAVMGSFEVHASRCIAMRGASMPPSAAGRYRWDGRGLSVLELYWEAIADKELVDRSAAGLAQEMSVSVLKVHGLAGKSSQQTRDTVLNYMRALVRQISSVGALILPAEDSYERHPLAASGFADLDGTARRAMAAVEGIPQAAWFGDAPGGLNTDGESWRQALDRLTGAHQADRYLPALRRLYGVILRSRGMDPAKLQIEFHELHEPSAREVAETRLLHAQRDATHIQAGVLDPWTVAHDRYGGAEYGDEVLWDPGEIEAYFAADPEPMPMLPGDGGGGGPTP